MIRWVPADPPYREAVHALLTETALKVGALDGVPDLDDLLRAVATAQVRQWGLPGVDAPFRLVREARFQITRTIAIEPRDRDDPLIGLVMQVLERHPAEPVARILQAAARRVSGRTSDPPPGR
ncbi:hypothetical protein Airi01_074570 [Actinoallomurus iriomotensis]|uniref:Uncharacterized protein n=1 Tax=Actinoallomurus iriomotensis TaxID=478107 RepID=A0A9W6VSZ1_9ACTN|nr:hypothetical protein Airi01_074570 [Actinoallomurus iriomotensis]